MGRFDSLFKWRTGDNAPSPQPSSPEELVEALSVEGLPDREIPPVYRTTVTTFRHLTQQARLTACRTFLLDNRIYRVFNGVKWFCERPGYWVSDTDPPLHCYHVMQGTQFRQWEVWSEETGGELLSAELDMKMAIRSIGSQVCPPPKEKA